MSKAKTITLSVLALLMSFSALADADGKATPQKEFYIIPEDVKCRVNKKDKITRCTDLNGTLITGEMRKFRENTLIRSYPLKDGILEGMAKAYYISGNKLSEKPYKKGQLDGLVKTYYKNGTLETATPYQKGKKEGVAKAYYENGTLEWQGIYINNALNGASRLYATNGNPIWELKFSQQFLQSGVCLVTEENGSITKYKISKEKIQCYNAKRCTPIYEEVKSENPCDFYTEDEEEKKVPAMEPQYYAMIKAKTLKNHNVKK